VWVDGDRIRLTQVVDNLLSNAIKYTPDGGALRLSLAADAATTTVTVTDTGVGIPPDLLPHVFGVFRQAEQSLDRSLGGLGLGLPLVKSLVELHHGSIRAESDGPGRGARFVVELPRGAPPAPAEPAQAAATRPLDIVLIEDNRDSAEALKSLLELWGHRLTVAGTGNAGVEAVMSRAGEVDVVLCDIGLPQGMSGYDVARILRRDPATRHVTLVALTGYGRPEDKARCFDAGFDRHVTKPLDIDAIQELLDDAGQSATN
jgi:CheY-like chemotaxis protein